MTPGDPSPIEWRLVEVRPSVDGQGSPAVTFRRGAESQIYFMSPDRAEEAAWQLLEAAKLARAGIGQKDPGTER